ncbi:carboxypeptidase regulatory-like domain-containing protein [bacterium]|nr:carboxypeptidase regulatory-like domain-containing protein [bacterium]
MRSKFICIITGLVLTIIFGALSSQAAAVMGTVTDGEGNPVVHAHVTLKSPPWQPFTPPDYAVFTQANGTYFLPEVEPNAYRIRAHKPGFGWSGIIIEVTGAEPVVIDFQLPGAGPQGPPPEIIEVSGLAIVDTLGMNQYFLDEDEDGTPDYHLDFGPPWYEPGSGATRPENGDFIEITGGLIDHQFLLDNIIVFEINGLFWFAPPPPPGPSPEDAAANTPEGVAKPHIQSCSPNPFNPETTVAYLLPKAGNVKLSVWNLQGQQVATLIDGYRDAGSHQVTWNASSLTSGIYFFRLAAGSDVSVSKVVFTK